MKKQSIIILTAALLLVSGGILYMKMSQPRFAYVLNGQIYQDFEMKKQFESRATNVVQKRKNIIDSVSLILNMRIQAYQASQKKDSMEANSIRMTQQQLYMQKQQFDEDNQKMADEYDQQIWKQIDQYVQDYGKAKGYTFILGATGDGGIMFANEVANITPEVKAYINERFKTGK